MNTLTEKAVAAQVTLKAYADRAARLVRDDERGQGSVEYVGIILVVVAIVAAVVAGATPVGTAILTKLTNAVNSIGGGTPAG
jgi:Flp pilus assembly pilin Flp